MMLPAIDATSTYTSPGISFSPLSRAGAREATVEVKDCSRLKAESMVLLTASSVAVAYRYRNRRAFPISTASLSVGVGLWGLCVCSDGADVGGMVSEAGDGTGVVVALGDRKGS